MRRSGDDEEHVDPNSDKPGLSRSVLAGARPPFSCAHAPDWQSADACENYPRVNLDASSRMSLRRLVPLLPLSAIRAWESGRALNAVKPYRDSCAEPMCIRLQLVVGIGVHRALVARSRARSPCDSVVGTGSAGVDLAAEPTIIRSLGLEPCCRRRCGESTTFGEGQSQC